MQLRSHPRQREVLGAARRYPLARALEPIRNERVRRAPRSDCTRPSRKTNEGAFITPASDALVPPLGAPPPLRK